MTMGTKNSTTLTKLEIAEKLFNATKIEHRSAKIVVDTFFEAISSALAEGEEVKISGFGTFNLRDKQARPGRNPKTGQSVEISARRVVTFSLSPKIKSRLSHK